MMKKVLLGMAFALMSVAGYAQGVLGKWYTEAGDAQVEIYQSGDKLNGKIVWLEQGPETKDKHNPDAKLQSRKLMGVNILSGLSLSPRRNGRVAESTTPRMARTISAPSGLMATS